MTCTWTSVVTAAVAFQETPIELKYAPKDAHMLDGSILQAAVTKGTREAPLHLGVCEDSKCFGCCSNLKPSFFKTASLFLKAICALMFSLVELGCL